MQARQAFFLFVGAIFSGIFLPLPLYSQPVYNVKIIGGAIGDGTTDDTQAIQQTIDFAATNGGGIVYVPPGDYVLRPIPQPEASQVICLNLPSQIELLGADSSLSRLILADSVGNFDAMLGHFPSWEAVENISVRKLTINGNGTHNPILDESILVDQGKRSLFRMYLGQQFLIEACHFTDSKGVWNTVFNGLIEGVVIRNNRFDQIGDSLVDWDHSTIYTNGDDFLIENNEMISRYGPGTLGARTAIETHGSNQIIRDNLLSGFV